MFLTRIKKKQNTNYSFIAEQSIDNHDENTLGITESSSSQSWPLHSQSCHINIAVITAKLRYYRIMSHRRTFTPHLMPQFGCLKYP